METPFRQEIRFFVDNNSGPAISYISNKNLKMFIVQNEDITEFAGVASTGYFRIPMVPARAVDLMVKAFNNRTRERNYFRLYCQMLSDEISEKEFDDEIDRNEDQYVVDAPTEASADDIYTATHLSNRLMGMHSTDDFSSMFGIDDTSINNYIKAIENE